MKMFVVVNLLLELWAKALEQNNLVVKIGAGLPVIAVQFSLKQKKSDLM